jgi:hypothetical protein
MVTILLISFIFVVLEPIFDSIMDTVDHHHSQSIFSNKEYKILKWKPFKNQKWWNEEQGWKNKYVDYDADVKAGIEPRRVKWKVLGFTFNKPVQITDSWHFFKMLKITSHVIATVFFPSTIIWSIILDFNFWGFLILTLTTIGVVGGLRNKIFTIFYHNIWLNK